MYFILKTFYILQNILNLFLNTTNINQRPGAVNEPGFSTNTDHVKNQQPSRKKVKFSSSVSVILIPTKEEFINAGLSFQLWQAKKDYKAFQMSAKQEIMALINEQEARGEPISIKDAMKQLYQPQPIDLLEEAIDLLEPIDPPIQSRLGDGGYLNSSRTGLLMFQPVQPMLNHHDQNIQKIKGIRSYSI